MQNMKTTYTETITQFIMSLAMPIEYLDMIVEKVVKKINPLLATNKEPDELLTIDEVANLLKTSKAQIYQWVNQSQHGLSKFPFLKSGRLLRFSRTDIMKWLKSNGQR